MLLNALKKVLFAPYSVWPQPRTIERTAELSHIRAEARLRFLGWRRAPGDISNELRGTFLSRFDSVYKTD